MKNIFKIFGKGKEEDPADILRSMIIKKLREISAISSPLSAIDELSWTFEVFLGKYFSMGYAFTHEELGAEIAKQEVPPEIKRRVLLLSDTLTKIKYEGMRIGRDEFISLLKEAIVLVDYLARYKKNPASK